MGVLAIPELEVDARCWIMAALLAQASMYGRDWSVVDILLFAGFMGWHRFLMAAGLPFGGAVQAP